MNSFTYVLALCLFLQYKEIAAATDCNGVNVPNICMMSLTGTMRLPHPTDNHQFLMCEQGGRMYVVKCPGGETYDDDKKDCTAPQTTPVPTFDPYSPCTASRLAAGQIYWPYPGDASRYIQCRGVGSQVVNTCPLGQRYEPLRRAQGCVYPLGAITTRRPTTVTTMPTTAPANPCDLRFLTLTNLYFSYPDDSSKFIQCDFTGHAYVMQCPKGLLWNQHVTNCVESLIPGK